ncbi:MAG: transglycosylase domain-containing protein [Oscillospiraceae bacterium]
MARKKENQDENIKKAPGAGAAETEEKGKPAGAKAPGTEPSAIPAETPAKAEQGGEEIAAAVTAAAVPGESGAGETEELAPPALPEEAKAAEELPAAEAAPNAEAPVQGQEPETRELPREEQPVFGGPSGSEAAARPPVEKAVSGGEPLQSGEETGQSEAAGEEEAAEGGKTAFAAGQEAAESKEAVAAGGEEAAEAGEAVSTSGEEAAANEEENPANGEEAARQPGSGETQVLRAAGGGKKRRKKKSVAGMVLAGVFKFLFVVFCLGLMAASVAAVKISEYMVEATANDDTMLDLESVKLNQTSFFYALNPDNPNAEAEDDWQVYQELVGPEHRIWVSGEQIPEDLKNAVIAIEDRDFYNHNGVSIPRTIYATLNEFLNLSDTSFGASTIEQQLVKNLTGEKESEGQSGYERKMREMFRAWGLDKRYSKAMIMEAYLNTISLSGKIAGVQAGANEYFGKDVSELNLQECAMIAGITRAPGAYNPYTNPENCLNRRNSVLEQMLATGKITQQQYDEAVVTPLGLIEKSQSETSVYGQVYSYFSDQVFEDVVKDLMEKYSWNKETAVSYMFTGGLKVYTTVDLNIQSTMEDMYYNGYKDDGFFTLRKDSRTGKLYKDVLTVKETAEDGTVTEVLPQSAAVVIDYTGALRGVVGGIGEKTESRVLNRATQSTRQVGSTMKPIGAYALAIENGLIDYSSMIVDSGVSYKGGSGSVNPETGEPNYNWPRNATGSYRNVPMAVVSAIAESTNTIAVKVGMRVGVEEMFDFLQNTLQISSLVSEGAVNDKDFAPLVLGSLTNGITTYELAGAYMMFGNGGKFYSLHSYSHVTDASGNEILRTKQTAVQAISEETAYVMNRLLYTVINGAPGVSATAAGFGLENTTAVAKTGTTTDNNDRWFVGLTPYYVSAVWWGYDKGFDDAHTLNWGVGRANIPPNVWKTLMDDIHQDLPQIDFPEKPSGVKVAAFCNETGQLAGPNCPSTTTGYYTSLRVPDTCTLHGG